MNKKIKRSRARVAIAGAALLMMTACASAKKNDPVEFDGKTVKAPKPPGLKNAVVKTLWIPEKIEGDRWEEGHFLYVIEKPSTWSVE